MWGWWNLLNRVFTENYGSDSMKYDVDIELIGKICIEANDEQSALDIANSISTDDLKDFLYDSKAEIIREIKDVKDLPDRIFSTSDI